MRKGTTESGFKYEYDERRLNDMQLVDDFALMVDTNASVADQLMAQSRALDRILGKEMKAALYAHIAAANDGMVPPDILGNELNAILTGGKPSDKKAKN